MPAVVGFLLAFLVVLAWWPEVNALAAIGPHPDGGGRFYGVTNQVETLLLAPSLAAAALAGVAGAAAIGLLLLVTVGWSRTGADGGGVLVVAASFAVLLAGLGRIRATAGRIALGIALVAADRPRGRRASTRSLGGSSHVTDAVGGGPGALLDDLDRRVRISWAGATSAPHTGFLCLLSLGGLAWLGVRGRHEPVILGDARRDRYLAGRQRHAGRCPRLRRARLPRPDGLGRNPRCRCAQCAQRGSEPPSSAARAPAALTASSTRTTPARATDSRTVPSAPFERHPTAVRQYGDQFIAIR